MFLKNTFSLNKFEVLFFKITDSFVFLSRSEANRMLTCWRLVFQQKLFYGSPEAISSNRRLLFPYLGRGA